MQQRLLEDQIAAHRKTKKSLSAKQRTAKKAGRAFAKEDAAQLRHVTELQGMVQKQLEQVRPQHAPLHWATLGLTRSKFGGFQWELEIGLVVPSGSFRARRGWTEIIPVTLSKPSTALMHKRAHLSFSLPLCGFDLVNVEAMLISDPQAAEKSHRANRRLQDQTAEGAAAAPYNQPSHDAPETEPAWGSAPPTSWPQHQRRLAVRGRSSWVVCSEGTCLGST